MSRINSFSIIDSRARLRARGSARPAGNAFGGAMVLAGLLSAISIAQFICPAGAKAGDARRLPVARAAELIGKAVRREDSSITAKRLRALGRVASWGYQLRNVSVDGIAATPFDLVVIDHASGGLAGYEARFSRADIAAMKRKPGGGRRFVIAYLSIGEAESYRFYWNKQWSTKKGAARPSWLGGMNARWERNFPVRFWMAQWQRIIFGSNESYLASIMAAGFDGVYLDRADVFLEWRKSHGSAETDMVRFIADLASHARKRDPRFFVIMQNAEELLRHRALRLAIDGVAKEDLYYGIEHGAKANSAANIEWSLRQLKLAGRAGRKMFLVEYLSDRKKAAKVRIEAARHGLIAYIGARNLDMMIGNDGKALAPPGLTTAGPGKAFMKPSAGSPRGAPARP